MKRSRDRESRMNVKVLIYVTERHAHEKKLHLILVDAALALLDCLERKVSRKEKKLNKNTNSFFNIIIVSHLRHITRERNCVALRRLSLISYLPRFKGSAFKKVFIVKKSSPLKNEIIRCFVFLPF